MNTSDSMTLPSDQDASGRSFGPNELRRVAAVLERGTLTGTKGPEVPELERRFAGRWGVGFATACSSGSSAVHAAIAALDLEPGDEVITTPITDMGAISPILQQGLIPVFADVSPRTANVTAETVEAALSERTRAVIVTHLFGNPCDVDAIRNVLEPRAIPIIEDCAQAFLARSQGRLVGTLGDVAAFSFQQGKHITAGEGGIVITDDAALARRVRLFVNKGWPYGEPNPDHEFLAPNARFSELGAAVTNAQLEHIDAFVARRITMAERLSEALADVGGLIVPSVAPGDVCSFWRYALLVDADIIAGGPDGLARELAVEGITSAPRYIQKPAFECAVIKERRTFGKSEWPYSLARPEALDYRPERYPGCFEALSSMLVLSLNERYRAEHIDYIADCVRGAGKRLAAGA